MRIIAGQWRGRALQAPPGNTTRPTADRARQALFDMLIHAPWSDGISGASVLDVFAGTGALGLEALSRGAVTACFIEQDRAALTTLRSNIAACRAESMCRVIEADACRLPRQSSVGNACRLVFLDPPYGRDLVPLAVASLQSQAWFAPGAIIVAETGRGETLPVTGVHLASRVHGAAQWIIWRAT
jgi:16S rRNA (guanine966-N2)-methyltransferase